MTSNDSIGILDMHGNDIHTGDIVNLFGMKGKVTQECGAYGIAFDTTINWALMKDKIKDITRTNNQPAFCYNDNFISFYELIWNYNCEDGICDVVFVANDT